MILLNNGFKKNPKVFIIILNYNGKGFIRKCLNSVLKIRYPNFEVVLVDNNSTDGSLELAKSEFSRISLIKNESNLGFSAGNNVGIRFALEKMADYVFLLNNDTSVEENILSNLLNAAEREREAGIVGPLILNRDKKSIWFSGGKIDWLKMKAFHERDNVESTAPFKTEYVSGCAMLIKKEVFRAIGLLDEDFFLYYEDTDFCFRAGEYGFSSMIVPSENIIHFEKSESTIETKTYWLVISGIIFFKKNCPSFLRPWMSFYLQSRIMKNRIDIWKGKNGITKSIQRAFRDYKKWEK